MNLLTRVLRILCAIQISITFIVSSVITNVLQLGVWCSLFLPLRIRLNLVQKLANGWYDVTNFALTRFGGVRYVQCTCRAVRHEVNFHSHFLAGQFVVFWCT